MYLRAPLHLSDKLEKATHLQRALPLQQRRVHAQRAAVVLDAGLVCLGVEQGHPPRHAHCGAVQRLIGQDITDMADPACFNQRHT